MIREALKRNIRGLQRMLKPSTDIAKIIDKVSEEEKIRIFKSLPSKYAADIIFAISEYSREVILRKLPIAKLLALAEFLDSDEIADLLEYVPIEKRKQVLKKLPREKARAVRKLLKYNPETAGGLMQTEVVLLHENDTVEEALKKLRKAPRGAHLSVVYVTDKEGKLKGFVSLRRLIRSPPDKKIKQIMVSKVLSVPLDMDQEEVAKRFKQSKVFSMPVLDKEGRIQGVITIDDVIDVIEEEVTEDIYKNVGLGEDEDVFDPVKKVWFNRTSWLITNLFTAFLAAIAVYIFQGTIERAVILAVFMPIVAGMGGNAGTQTMTVVIRGLTLGRVKLNDVLRIIIKETTLGLIAGVITGLIAGVVAYLWNGEWIIGVVIFLSMIIELVVAALAGVLVPVMLKHFGVDPAVSSSIILTTITDITGFVSFLGLASLLI